MREMRYMNMVPQETDFSCGAAALATILKHAYGQEITEHRVIEDMMKVSDQELVREQGFSMLDMKRYVEAIGMRGRGYNVQPEALEKLQVPVVVLLDIRGYKHFVVLKKTVVDRVYIGDPALGNRVMDRE
ncbi:MAG: C39 family peptidase [Rhodocyclaceae bacterium]|nr:C39 family peptidase [Rhodocyclaceae bacterium]